jgi:hypothetical protein
MQAAYRIADQGFYNSDEFNKYQSLYSELSSEIIENGEAAILTDLVPLLEDKEFQKARELLDKEVDINEASGIENSFDGLDPGDIDVFYVDDEDDDRPQYF